MRPFKSLLLRNLQNVAQNVAPMVKEVSKKARKHLIRAVSSAGRAPGLHPGGRQFETVTAHHSAPR